MSETRPRCFGEMYLRGEGYMLEYCLRCRAFNDCKKIGGGVEVETVITLIPREPDIDKEYRVKW